MSLVFSDVDADHCSALSTAWGAEVAEDALTHVKAAVGSGHGLATFRQQQEAGVTDRGWAMILAMAPLMADPSPDCWDAVDALVRAMRLFQNNRSELLGTVAPEARFGDMTPIPEMPDLPWVARPQHPHPLDDVARTHHRQALLTGKLTRLAQGPCRRELVTRAEQGLDGFLGEVDVARRNGDGDLQIGGDRVDFIGQGRSRPGDRMGLVGGHHQHAGS